MMRSVKSFSRRLGGPLLVAFLVASAGAVTPWSLVINTNNVITVTAAPYGAVGDGSFVNTTAIQNAINAAAAGSVTNGLRGGMVLVPAGTFLCGPLALKSNVRLQLDAGAILRLLPYGTYPGAPYTSTVVPFLSGSGLTNLAVTGAGLIDGQGEPWWRAFETNGINRPALISLSACSRVAFADYTSSNPPTVHISIKGANAGSVNFTGIHLFAPASDDPVNPSHNTDGVDFAETNGVFAGCVISTGDDNIAIGSSASVSRDVLVTNCFFGEGHGLSIGSYTSGGVSNLTVIDCTFSNTGNGIKVKSERNRGGVVQNLNYFNLTMTNVDWPIQIYAYYEYGLGTLTGVDPVFAANTAFTSPNPSPYKPPIYRNITISNVTANILNGRPPLLIWGLPDYPVANVVLQAVRLTSSSTKTSGIYNATNVQFIDCSLSVPAGGRTLQLWNADVTFTNRGPAAGPLMLDGLTTNGIGNTLGLFNAPAVVANTNALAGGAITLGGSTLTVSNSLNLPPTSTVNFVLGTNATDMVVTGDLALNGMLNVDAGPGFTNGSFPLFAYGKALAWGPPVLNRTPADHDYRLDTNWAGLVRLMVTNPPPAAPTNLTATATNLGVLLKWSAVPDAASYTVQRSLTNGGPYAVIASQLSGTTFSDGQVASGTTYYYVANALNAAGESANSVQVSATPLPSLSPASLTPAVTDGGLELGWPADHIGWRLEAQTNTLAVGLGTNWTPLGYAATNAANLPISPGAASVFYRLVYP